MSVNFRLKTCGWVIILILKTSRLVTISIMDDTARRGLTQFQEPFKATFHLTISMRGQRATGKIQRNNYNHGNCGSSLTG